MLSMTTLESSPSAASLEMPRKPWDSVTEPKNELVSPVTLNPLVFDASPLNVIGVGVVVESLPIPPARVTRELRLFPVEKNGPTAGRAESGHGDRRRDRAGGVVAEIDGEGLGGGGPEVVEVDLRRRS